MKGDRRSVVAGIATSLLATITGYLSPDEGDDSSDDSGAERAGADGTGAAPDPTVVGRTAPDPTVVWVDDEPTADGRHEFSAEIYNAGTGGEVGLSLLWLDGPETRPVEPREAGSSRMRFLEADERAELSITTRVPDGYRAYELRIRIRRITVTVENDGGSGRIGVSLLEQNRLLDETDVVVDAEDTVSLTFEGDYSTTDPTALEFEASPIEFSAS